MTARAKTHVGIVFDDGFARSSLATARLFEEFRLPAVFAVLADRTGLATKHEVGDWTMWNELQSRGHIIQPHGFQHVNLRDLAHDAATEQVKRCLDAFTTHLRGFDAKNAVYCCAYNCSTPNLNTWLIERVRAVRWGGSGFLT